MEIMIKPIVTEKATKLTDKLNRYTFRVSVDANKDPVVLQLTDPQIVDSSQNTTSLSHSQPDAMWLSCLGGSRGRASLQVSMKPDAHSGPMDI